MKLIVQTPFSGHQTGDEITDAAEVASVLASEHARYVTPAAWEPPPVPKAPAPDTTSKPA